MIAPDILPALDTTASSPSPAVASIVKTLTCAEDLTRTQSRSLFTEIARGRVSNVHVAAILAALRTKTESTAEITGAVDALRAVSTPFEVPLARFVDNCGTGGDGASTVNISTAAAIVAAELGVPIVKHGNRSVSSRCGSADVLEQVGVAIRSSSAAMRTAFAETRFAFLFAPQYHPALAHSLPVRRALGTRTIFNLIGPLLNPARPPVQLVGVYDAERTVTLAKTLGELGLERALVIHCAGLDEFGLHAETRGTLMTRQANGRHRLQPFEISPEEVGLESAPIAALRGHEPEHNAEWLRELLAGNAPLTHAHAVAFNAGALEWLFCDGLDGGDALVRLRDSVQRALDCIRGGATLSRLERIAEVSHAR